MTTEIARNEFGERVYSLADFAADGVDVAHPLAARRIPVLRDYYPHFKYHTALVVGGPDYMPREQDAVEPEPFEIEQLCADLEYRMRYYNDRYRRRVAARGAFDVDGTVNTHTFRKHPEHGWQYHVMTWESGVTWFPTPPWSKVGPFSLEALLDRVHSLGDGPPMPRWLEVKADSGAFGELTIPPGQRPTATEGGEQSGGGCDQCKPRRSDEQGSGGMVGRSGCGSCLTCDPPRSVLGGLPMMRMYVCATCGNKRCPAASDCRKWKCSGSNDPGQVPVLRDDYEGNDA